MTKMIDINELYIGVKVFMGGVWQTNYYKALNEALTYACEKINKGYKTELFYCNKYGCEI